jgi:ankyrin repeat protein
MQAAMSGHARVCDALIAKGQVSTRRTNAAMTPLHKAVTDGHVAVAEVLVPPARMSARATTEA